MGSLWLIKRYSSLIITPSILLKKLFIRSCFHLYIIEIKMLIRLKYANLPKYFTQSYEYVDDSIDQIFVLLFKH